jgi:hypothetical protein
MKNKRGEANLFIVLFLTLIVLASIIIVWNLVNSILKKQGATIEMQETLSKERFNVKSIKIDPPSSGYNMTLIRVSGEYYSVNAQASVVQQPAYIFSVIDLSGSMDDNSPGRCEMNTTSGCCLNHNNCNNLTDCQACTGIFQNSVCTMNSSCSINKAKCTSCRGINWKNKLGLSVEANKILIDDLLLGSNKIGFVGYNTTAPGVAYQDLTDNATLLKNKLDKLVSSGNTCICCGINKATNTLMDPNYNNKTKIIVLMSDGAANTACGGGTPKQNAINSAAIAHNNYNITVYSIGFGADVDQITLTNIAIAGNGSYYYSNISNINDIYSQVSHQIIEQYTVVSGSYFRVIFYNETSTYTAKIYDSLGPFETKTFTIPTGSYITNPNKLELYFVMTDEYGNEVSGPLIYSGKIN